MLPQCESGALPEQARGEGIALPQSVVISAPWQVVLALPASRGLLGKDETDRMARFVRAADADRFCAAHSLARLVLSGVTGQPPALLAFLRQPGGKPCLKDSAGMDFNLSHGGDWVSTGICRHGMIGVDVEEVRPVGFWREIAASFLTPAELEHIPSDADAWYFLRLWTAKEAAVKATGDGFAIAPNKISIGWDGDGPQATITECTLAGQTRTLDARHLLAVMTDGDRPPSLMIARDVTDLTSALAALRDLRASH